MSTPDADQFPDFLRSRLLQGTRIRAYHVSTPASSCPPLFAPASGRSEESTTLESHFLAISQARQNANDTAEHHPPDLDVLVLGIEVLIFTTTNVTTVFVSKADSTGLLTKPATVVSHRTSLVQTAITAFLHFLLRSRQHHHRLVLSLFARSQNQYLFPGSIENATKHVLDDRQLIKWWCRVIDPLARQKNIHSSPVVRAHIVVPGCDRGETKAFFPPSARSDPPSDPKWVNAYPVSLLVQDSSLPPRCLVPRLPDDPKSRFLDDLDAQRDNDGVWRGIKTLEQFWEMMSYRQECSAGRLVGFLWVVFGSDIVPSKADGAVNDETFMQPQNLMKQHHQDQRQEQEASEPTAVTPSTPTLTRNILLSHQSLSTSSTIDPASSEAPSSRPTTTAETTTAASITGHTVATSGHVELPDTTTVGQPDLTEASVITQPVPTSTAEIQLSVEDYQTLMDELLRLDFAGEALGIESSRKWRETAMKLAGASAFGVDIVGESTEPEQSTVSNVDAKAAVNMITGVRKKRKTAPTPHDSVASDCTNPQPVTHTLASSLTRKKVKH